MSENETKEVVEKKDEASVEIQPVNKVEVTEAKTDTKPASEAHPDDAKRTGIKEVVVDSEAMAIEKEKGTEPVKVASPSFFVTDERRKIEIDVLTVKDTGKIVSISRVGLAGLDFQKDFPFLSHRQEWFEFTVPTYEDMSTYRQRSAIWRKEAGQMLVDRLQLRNFFLVWHLKDWSLTDKDGKKVELTYDKDSSLTAESIKVIYSMQAAILDIVLTMYEKDILLV